MNKYILIISAFFACGYNAQTTAELNTISSGGGEAIAGGNSYSYDIGGLSVETVSTGSNKYTQGFEQPTSAVNLTDFKPPNAFSPDGDGVNETWIIPLEMISTENTVIIFNRWGDIISTIEDYNNLDNVWDGNHQENGQSVLTGTYFYVVESPSTTQKFSGWVQVVR
jgi:gliding motility-associated-like protein